MTVEKAVVTNWLKANVSLALGSNLHAMPDPDYATQGDFGLLPSPLTRQHAIERAHLWWSIFMIDFQVSIILGVPRHIRLDPLEVTFDLPVCRYETNPCPAAECYHHKIANGVRYLSAGTSGVAFGFTRPNISFSFCRPRDSDFNTRAAC